MRKWKHLVVRHYHDEETCTLQDLDRYVETILNSYGSEGWEVVSVSSDLRSLASKSKLENRQQMMRMRVQATFKKETK